MVNHFSNGSAFLNITLVESMRNSGLIKGGSLDNAIVCSFRIKHTENYGNFNKSEIFPKVSLTTLLIFLFCSASEGWLNPPLRFHDEPCRHKVLDLVGDLSLFACSGSQGVPVAHIVAFKARGSHALHADFARCLSRTL
ncbi:hypothetical protein JRO89_XS05G0212200 [Xanthoceras sorbifolium]|uniref:Uncharacterized protein n=1 Tax=Xanthoceras sorbifolium TaxID=99658 RepID=A0ABQ8I2Q5_9ROSI|nr:hypothetical protein JRO89_XS05G0212200 [Xanthoceras sorbifolium]